MALCVTSLASGSSGNALLLRTDTAAVLVDCGISQRTLERTLAHAGMRPADLSAILLTHEHGDHVGCAAPFARRHSIPVIANGPTLAAIGQALTGVQVMELPTGTSREFGEFRAQSFAVPHDAAEPVGYTIHAAGSCVGIAVDLGSWSDEIVAGLAHADLLVVEANYDHERLRSAPYDWSVKQRIYGPRGHLDNVESGRLLAQVGADGRTRTAWLAHLSQEANSPAIAVRVVNGVLSLASIRCIDVHALPRRTTLSWESDRHLRQMELFS